MFTSEQRDAVRRRLLGLAEEDPRITAAAVTGSGADGREDRWSDVDLFFGIADQAGLDAVVSDWSGHLYGELGALHHFDLRVPGAVYRAFLLPSCLEVDLGFTPADQFGPVGPQFRAVFGAVANGRPATSTDPGTWSGLAGSTDHVQARRLERPIAALAGLAEPHPRDRAGRPPSPSSCG